MKSLLCVLTLALSLSAVAQENLGLSECQKGKGGKRTDPVEKIKSESSQDKSGSESIVNG